MAILCRPLSVEFHLSLGGSTDPELVKSIISLGGSTDPEVVKSIINFSSFNFSIRGSTLL